MANREDSFDDEKLGGRLTKSLRGSRSRGFESDRPEKEELPALISGWTGVNHTKFLKVPKHHHRVESLLVRVIAQLISIEEFAYNSW